jgi:transposase
MMGDKARAVTPRHTVSLQDLVPADHFYRHLDRVLDLAFVRDLVRDTYAPVGRPSIDPVVYFRLQLVLFFEGLRSERQLMRVAADRLSVRWYLGYDLGEPLPDHSSLTRIRERYGLEVFRRFFEAVVERCQGAGLVWGRELYLDATKVEANASMDSLKPRFAVEAHLARLFRSEPSDDDRHEPEVEPCDEGGAGDREPPSDAPRPSAVLPPATAGELTEANAGRHDWLAAAGRPERAVTRGHYQRISDFLASATDPDATPMQTRSGVHLGYHDHYVVDGGKARIILRALVTPAEVMENQPARDLLWRARFRWRLRPRQATGDTTYGTVENIVALEREGLRAYVPLPDWGARTAYFGPEAFTYDAARDVYVCPRGTALRRLGALYRDRVVRYQAPAAACNACPVKAQCTPGRGGRAVRRSFDEAYLDRVRAYHATEAYKKAMRKRAVWVEPLFGEAKQWHGLRRFRLRTLPQVNAEALLTATGQNLKRLLRRRGWGRRPWPGGAAANRAPGGLRAVVPRRRRATKRLRTSTNNGTSCSRRLTQKH